MNRNGTAIILIVLAIGIYFTVTQSIFNQVKDVQKVNSQYLTAISNAEQLISVREKVLKAYNGLSQDDRDRLDKMIPNTVDNIRLIIDLNSVALSHGFALKNVKAVAAASKTPAAGTAIVRAPGTTPATGGISTPTLDTVTVTFGVETGYLEFISFLQDLEANLRIMDVSRLSMKAAEGGRYSFEVELKTYWLRQ
jgi:hypothetical protein